MVQPASKRKERYNAKYDPAIVETRFIAAETGAKASFATAADVYAQMEADVQVVLNTDDIPTMDRPKYYNFGREIQALVNQGVTDPALTTTVVDLLFPKYDTRGCVPATLIAIALNVFSITIPP